MSLVKSFGGKRVNFDFNKEFISIFSDKIKSLDIKFINQTLKDLHPSDVANLIENLSFDSRVKLIEIVRNKFLGKSSNAIFTNPKPAEIA